MPLLDQIKQKIFGSKSRFLIGESVQLKNGGALMVITEIFAGKKFSEPLINCKWYESEQKITRTNLFPESSLKPFDWYKPNP